MSSTLFSLFLPSHWNCLKSLLDSGFNGAPRENYFIFTQTGTPLNFLGICSRLKESLVSEGYSSWPLEFQ